MKKKTLAKNRKFLKNQTLSTTWKYY